MNQLLNWIAFIILGSFAGLVATVLIIHLGWGLLAVALVVWSMYRTVTHFEGK